MTSITQHGYLVLADISGYTSYLAGVELEHAHEILTELLEVIVGKFQSLLTIGKLEGDAVFAYAPEAHISRGEILLELVEATYFAFQNRILSSRRHTTCQCRACQSMNGLDLKFIIHHGDYVVQNVMGIAELVGSDVNLAHRLMKNHVSQATGWQAYVLLTEQCLQHLGVRPAALHHQTETYDHLGQTQTCSYDLRTIYDTHARAQRDRVTPEEALVVLEQDFPVSVAVVWDWLNDPDKRSQYTAQKGLKFRQVFSSNGRRSIGSQTHCMHGERAAMKEVVLDWKPFEYYTVEQDSGAWLGVVKLTYQFEPRNDDTTCLKIFLTGRMSPRMLSPLLVKLVYGRVFYPFMLKHVAIRIAEQKASESASPTFQTVPEPVSERAG